MERNMSIGARIWISLCMAACVAVAVFLFIAMLANNGAVASRGGMVLSQLIVAIVVCYLSLAGYIVLMTCKKAGFYIVLGVAAAYAVFALATKQWVPALISLVHPFVTWLLVRPWWDRWSQPKRAAAVEGQELTAERAAPVVDRKPKSRKAALILAALPWTGLLGVDRFYLGYVGLGILKLLTAGGCLVLYVVDIVRIARGTMKDRYGRPLI